MSPLLELSVKEGVPSVQVGVEPSALPVGGVHVNPPPPRLLPPLSTLNDDFVSRPPLPPLPLPLLSKCTSDMLLEQFQIFHQSFPPERTKLIAAILIRNRNFNSHFFSVHNIKNFQLYGEIISSGQQTTDSREIYLSRNSAESRNSINLPHGIVISLSESNMMNDFVVPGLTSRKNGSGALMMATSGC